MKYNVVIDKQVLKQLTKIPDTYYNKIVIALNNLAENPRPVGCKKLKGRQGYRVRVADYRIIYISNNINNRQPKRCV